MKEKEHQTDEEDNLWDKQVYEWSINPEVRIFSHLWDLEMYYEELDLLVFSRTLH